MLSGTSGPAPTSVSTALRESQQQLQEALVKQQLKMDQQQQQQQQQLLSQPLRPSLSQAGSTPNLSSPTAPLLATSMAPTSQSQPSPSPAAPQQQPATPNQQVTPRPASQPAPAEAAPAPASLEPGTDTKVEVKKEIKEEPMESVDGKQEIAEKGKAMIKAEKDIKTEASEGGAAAPVKSESMETETGGKPAAKEEVNGSHGSPGGKLGTPAASKTEPDTASDDTQSQSNGSSVPATPEAAATATPTKGPRNKKGRHLAVWCRIPPLIDDLVVIYRDESCQSKHGRNCSIVKCYLELILACHLIHQYPPGARRVMEGFATHTCVTGKMKDFFTNMYLYCKHLSTT